MAAGLRWLAQPFETILSTDGLQPAANAGQKEEPSAKISLVEGSREQLLVQYLELFLHEIRGDIARWRIILAVPYQGHLLSK